MLNLFLRCLILYSFLLIAMRLMGKRQLGELQPFELAITLVASDLVCIPMADASIPIIYGLIPVFTLFLVHILTTKLATKSVRFRKFLNGKPVVLIENGNLLPSVMKELNMTVDDVMEALRGSGYFNPSEVEFAILETNGNLTVLPKSQNRPCSPEDLGIKTEPSTLPVTVIMEGDYIGDNVAKIPYVTKERVMKFLDNRNIAQKDVLLLLVSGEDVFLQPYVGEFLTATLSSDEATEASVSVHVTKKKNPDKQGYDIPNDENVGERKE
ncbi:MAG: DUF421 domain-containing protein [Clostridia bacterium]|nr:DUF421 domain-containing protein [Clostridia bacterium]